MSATPALAILNGPTALVYVQGYTLAEPAYPAVQEAGQLIRLGSCSKLLAEAYARAPHALLQNRKLKAAPRSPLDHCAS